MKIEKAYKKYIREHKNKLSKEELKLLKDNEYLFILVFNGVLKNMYQE